MIIGIPFFRPFDNSSEHWKIEGCNYKTAFCVYETTELLLGAFFEV